MGKEDEYRSTRQEELNRIGSMPEANPDSIKITDADPDPILKKPNPDSDPIPHLSPKILENTKWKSLAWPPDADSRPWA